MRPIIAPTLYFTRQSTDIFRYFTVSSDTYFERTLPPPYSKVAAICTTSFNI
jgi:hypothetical protein